MSQLNLIFLSRYLLIGFLANIPTIIFSLAPADEPCTVITRTSPAHSILTEHAADNVSPTSYIAADKATPTTFPRDGAEKELTTPIVEITAALKTVRLAPATPVKTFDQFTIPADIQAILRRATELEHDNPQAALEQLRSVRNLAYAKQCALAGSTASHDGVWSISTAKAARAMATNMSFRLVCRLDPTSIDPSYTADRAAYDALRREIVSLRARGSSY